MTKNNKKPINKKNSIVKRGDVEPNQQKIVSQDVKNLRLLNHIYQTKEEASLTLYWVSERFDLKTGKNYKKVSTQIVPITPIMFDRQTRGKLNIPSLVLQDIKGIVNDRQASYYVLS